MTKVLVADDDPLTMAGITTLLDKSNFEVVATVGTGAAVLETLGNARPDLLILDNGMPERSGLDVLRTLRSRGDDYREYQRTTPMLIPWFPKRTHP